MLPDMDLADGAFAMVEKLLAWSDPENLTRMELRRGSSTTYYGMFHELARTGADAFIGTVGVHFPKHAWNEIYRTPEHGAVATAFRKLGQISFPGEIGFFADVFLEVQRARIAADYNPMIRFTPKRVSNDLERAKEAVFGLRSLEQVHKTAFAAWILVYRGGVNEARERRFEGNVYTI